MMRENEALLLGEGCLIDPNAEPVINRTMLTQTAVNLNSC